MGDPGGHGQHAQGADGQGLVRVGALTEHQVSEVLIEQRTESGVDRMFGEIAVELGFCNDETINAFLDAGDEAAASI